MLKVVGWALWTIVALLAVSWTWGLRKYARVGAPFQMTTAVQTFFLWVIAITFLATSISKLHILWVGPVSLILAMLIIHVGIPGLSRLVVLMTRVFVGVVLFGVDLQDSNEE